MSNSDTPQKSKSLSVPLLCPHSSFPQGHTLDKYRHRTVFLILKGLVFSIPQDRGGFNVIRNKTVTFR